MRALKQPLVLQLLLCALLPPLSRHTAATAAFTQRALDARFVASLLDLLCGRAAAESKQHAARLLAALGGNPSGGSAIRAQLEKVEVWATYSRIPPSNTGNDILRLRRALKLDAADDMTAAGAGHNIPAPGSGSAVGDTGSAIDSHDREKERAAATAAGVASAAATSSAPAAVSPPAPPEAASFSAVPAQPTAAPVVDMANAPPVIEASSAQMELNPGDDDDDFDDSEEEYVD